MCKVRVVMTTVRPSCLLCHNKVLKVVMTTVSNSCDSNTSGEGLEYNFMMAL